MLLKNTIKKLHGVEHTRSRIEDAFKQGILIDTDIDRSYEALFLRSFVVFESYLENLFKAAITGKLQYTRLELTCRTGPLTTNSARLIVFGNQNYLKWMPYDNTLKLADKWLVGGRPFSNLDDAQRSFLKHATITRNAIAHSSPYSKREFLDKVIGSAAVSSRNKTPSRWLRQRMRAGQQDTRFQAYLTLFAKCMESLYPKSLAAKELA